MNNDMYAPLQYHRVFSMPSKSSVLHLLTPSLNAWQLLILLLSPWFCPFPECQVVGIIQYVDFPDWRLLLSNTCVFSWIDSSFLSSTEEQSIVWLYPRHVLKNTVSPFDGKSVLILFVILLYVMLLFSHSAFKIFSLSLIFNSVTLWPQRLYRNAPSLERETGDCRGAVLRVGISLRGSNRRKSMEQVTDLVGPVSRKVQRRVHSE